MKKRLILLINIVLSLLAIVLISCNEKQDLPYDADSPTYDMIVKVDKVGDYIEYSYRSGTNEDGSYIYTPIKLKFDSYYYKGFTNETNEYYVIVDKNSRNKLFPNQLRIGELLIFKAYSVQKIGDYIAGKCLEYMMKPNLEVASIGDTVKFKKINSDEEIDYLLFKNTDYGSTRSDYNDYYVIDGENKIEPSKLKVGDKLYFDIMYYQADLVYSSLVIVGRYLYLANKNVINNNES